MRLSRVARAIALHGGLAIMLAIAGTARAEESADWSVTPILKSHTIVTGTRMSGPGSQIAGLPMTYHMSLFESSWGGRQTAINGSGMTTNSTIPIAEGEALTENLDVGAEVNTPSGWVAGLQGEWYGLAGDRTVGRVFGDELPWDNFDRQRGAAVAAHSNLDLDRGWLRYASSPWSVQLVGGTLPSSTLPELSRKPMNHVRLGSLVWRVPIASGSYFEKADRKLEEGRHPVRGTDLLVDYEYADARHVHLEWFAGRTKPTPVAAIDRLSWGGRLGVDIAAGNVGATFVRADGDQPRSERQAIWAVDTSYPIADWLSPYGAWARSSYTRGSTVLDGTAVVGGLALKGPRRSEGKVQYQRLGENYNLIGITKIEHYPVNSCGVNAELSVPVGAGSVKGVIYRLRQIETNTTADDTIFGDSYFPALANSSRGRMLVWRLGGETGPWHRARLKGYAEQAQFRKDALDDTNDIDKLVTNLWIGPSVALTKSLTLEAGVRHQMATGRWQTMRFHHRQEVPEIALTYLRGKSLRATLLYNRYLFEDGLAAAQGNNDYTADQLIAEFKYTL